MKVFLGIALLVASIVMLFFACGPDSSGEKPTTVAENDLEVEASCLTASVGVCLNYVKYPTGAEESEIRELCEDDGVWSTKACSLEDVFGQCEVDYEGGTVVTYFFQPQSASAAQAKCTEEQDGEYTAL
jgi:hypothetical protein